MRPVVGGNCTPMSTALVLIDLQHDYFQDPELARCRDDVVRAVRILAEAAQRHQALVVEVRTVHEPDGSTWALNMLEDGQGMGVRGTPGVERLSGLPSTDVVVEKTRDSAFHRTALAEVLRQHQVDRLVLCGVSTESCIAATATEAYARDLRVTLVRDATASVDARQHDRTLALLAAQYRQELVEAGRARFDSGGG